jgi:hypothetical protein
MKPPITFSLITVHFVWQQKKLESLDKEKNDLETLRSELEVLKLEAEKAEREAKDQYQQVWHGTMQEAYSKAIRKLSVFVCCMFVVIIVLLPIALCYFHCSSTLNLFLLFKHSEFIFVFIGK